MFNFTIVVFDGTSPTFQSLWSYINGFSSQSLQRYITTNL